MAGHLPAHLRHEPDDPALGQPLCLRCYDYVGAVLWNAHAGDLWRRTTIYIRDEMAKRAGISRTALQKQLRLSYVKAAEFQARGVVHFHVILRADGPEGPSTPAPEWADVMFVGESVRAATSAARLRLDDLGGLVIRWGSELDIRQVIPEDEESHVTEQAVAAYVAKYATKAAEVSGTVDRPIRSAGEIANLRVSEHTRSYDLHRMGAGGPPGVPTPAASPLGAHARLPRSLLHQVEGLLHDARSSASGPRRLPRR